MEIFWIMRKIKSISYKKLRNSLDPKSLDFESTDSLKPINGFLGQERAREALSFGIGIKSQGYNMYAMGPSGIGKFSLIKAVLEDEAKNISPPDDWCYIYNFEDPEKPLPLHFPAGQGAMFQADMKRLLDEISANIVAVYESDSYHNSLRKIHNKMKKIQREKNKSKKSKNLMIGSFAQLCKEKSKKEKELNFKLFSSVVNPLISRVREKYQHNLDAIVYLNHLQNDILDHVVDFIKQDEQTNAFTFAWENPSLTKYKVNLLVDNRNQSGAPVIFEDAPSYTSLFCRVEHTGEQGTPTTNFTLIKPGALHKANGGYLIIESRKLKKNKDAWEALKNALYTKKIKIKTIEHDTDTVKPISLEPVSIPLSVKVVLLGDRGTYYSLCQYDPDFGELFKVAVDFDEQIDRNSKNIKLYARLIKTISERENLKSFSASAVAAIIDFSSELAEDREKLSTHIRDIEDLLLESNYWAGVDSKQMVSDRHVKKAIDAKIRRLDRSRELYYEDILRDFIIIKTVGKTVGQVNCLSVRRVGNFSYGHPTRVTARVKPGKGELIDIQREIKLAGPMHSKAGLIISHYLASMFNKNHLYSISASISFEQIYCWTDGDSASVGELCALLSAIAEIPIKQSLAVTGSIDQHGNVQAIGGVNQKIEGFFDICAANGLKDKPGVIIPKVNLNNLMLRDDVIRAVKMNRFSIYAIDTLDDALTLLTGMEVGRRLKNGKYVPNSFYDKIELRLAEYNRLRFSKR
jgi:lon-related putative ATP-dependent protease